MIGDFKRSYQTNIEDYTLPYISYREIDRERERVSDGD